MKRRHTPCRSRGLASFIAIAMIGLLALALLALTQLLQADARRSMRHGAEVQLRQLLLAGGVAAARATDGPSPPTQGLSVPVPEGLDDAAISLDFHQPDDATLLCTATARYAQYRAIQSMRFERVADGWVLRDVQVQRQH